MLFHNANDGGAHDSAIRQASHLASLLGVRDAEANGHRRVGDLADLLDDGAQIRGDLGTGSGNAQGAHQVDEALSLGGDHGDAVLGGWGDHRDEIDALRSQDGSELLLLLVGHVRQDEAADAGVGGVLGEALDAVVVHHVAVGHEHQRRVNLSGQLLGHGEDLVGIYATGQRPEVGALNDGTLCRGIREGNAQLDDGGAGVREGVHDLLGGF